MPSVDNPSRTQNRVAFKYRFANFTRTDGDE